MPEKPCVRVPRSRPTVVVVVSISLLSSLSPGDVVVLCVNAVAARAHATNTVTSFRDMASKRKQQQKDANG